MRLASTIAGRVALAALLTMGLVVSAGPSATAATTAVVSGRITNADGAGVARARVTIFAPGTPARTVIARTRAGSDGRYRLPAVPLGTYVLRATDPSLANAATWWPDASNSFAASPITVTAAGLVTDVVMIKGLAISGVTRFQGVPRARVKVCVLAADIPCAFSGRNGRYTVRGIAPDYYRLTAEPTRRRSPFALTWWPEYSDAFSVIASPELIDSESATKSWDFTLVPRPKLTGRVVDQNGAGVARAKVCVSGSSTCARSKSDGGFVLEAEVPFRGSLDLVARRRGYAVGGATTLDNDGVVITLQKLTLTRPA